MEPLLSVEKRHFDRVKSSGSREAAIESKDQSDRMFGVEGLIQAIAAVRSSAGGSPTGRLRDLLSSVSGREQFDDDLSLMRLSFDPAQT